MQKLNVAIVVESLHTRGGVERRTSELVSGLLSAGHEVHIYADRWDPAAAPGAGFHRIRILKLGRALKPLSFAWFCSLGIPNSGHDLVHTQARIFRFDVATLGVGCHRAYLDAMHIDPGRAPDRCFHRSVLHIERTMLRSEHYSRIITNSNKCKGELIGYYGVPEEAVRVIHNGVDGELFSPQTRAEQRDGARRELGLHSDEVAILFAGSGFARKGLDTLVEAVGELRNRDRVKILVLGRGKRDEYERLAAASGIGGRLVWIGQSADVIGYYAAADIYALPTRYDPFANSTMEALACALPVVTTTANGVSEILADGANAFIIKPDDPGALAERLEALLPDRDLCARLGMAGHRAVEPYTWQRTTEETMQVYEEIVGNGGRA